MRRHIGLSIIILAAMSAIGLNAWKEHTLGGAQNCTPSTSAHAFTFDEKIVAKIVPNYQTCTVTVILKNGKQKTFTNFSWDHATEFETAAKAYNFTDF